MSAGCVFVQPPYQQAQEQYPLIDPPNFSDSMLWGMRGKFFSTRKFLSTSRKWQLVWQRLYKFCLFLPSVCFSLSLSLSITHSLTHIHIHTHTHTHTYISAQWNEKEGSISTIVNYYEHLNGITMDFNLLRQGKLIRLL